MVALRRAERCGALRTETIIATVFIPLAAIGGALAVKFLDRLRRRDADAESEQIIEQAQQEVANRRKEAELEIKESMIRQKGELESEMNRTRDELRERERNLERRQESADKKADHLLKQERIVESTQRRLAEKVEDTERRNVDLSKLLDMQRQTLHELSGLDQ